MAIGEWAMAAGCQDQAEIRAFTQQFYRIRKKIQAGTERRISDPWVQARAMVFMLAWQNDVEFRKPSVSRPTLDSLRNPDFDPNP